jgi:hypothetical protein
MKKTLSIMAITTILLVLASCGAGNSTLSGTIRDTLSLEFIDDALVTVNSKTAQTNNEGMFIISGLAPGNVNVEIIKEGYRSINFPEYAIKEGDNFIEATMDLLGEAKNLPSKEFGKPQPNPPPLPGKPVDSRPTLKVVENYDGYKLLISYGDQKIAKNSQTIMVSNDVTKILPQNQVDSDLGVTIFTKDAIYSYNGTNWIGIKKIPDTQPHDVLTDIKHYLKTILDCYKNQGSQLNLLGSKKYNNIDCHQYRVVGFTGETASKVDGEIYVPKSGQYKDTILYFVGILEVNGPGDKITLEFQPGVVKSIEIPKNAIMQDPGQQPPNPEGR